MAAKVEVSFSLDWGDHLNEMRGDRDRDSWSGCVPTVH